MDKEQCNDRRSDKRFKVQDGVFVALSHSERKNWQVIDISRSGLSFRYIPQVEDLSRSTEVDLVTRDTLFSLRRISFQSVSDAVIDDDFMSRYSLSRHGVKFGKLTPSQLDQVGFLINNYTVGEA